MKNRIIDIISNREKRNQIERVLLVVTNFVAVWLGVYFTWVIYKMISSGAFVIMDKSLKAFMFGIRLDVADPWTAGYYLGEIAKCQAMAIFLVMIIGVLWGDLHRERFRKLNMIGNISVGEMIEKIRKRKG